jgi:hypothetical protein
MSIRVDATHAYWTNFGGDASGDITGPSELQAWKNARVLLAHCLQRLRVET